MNAVHNLNLFWFRRDLRLSDNHALHLALKNGQTICCFIWDQQILDNLQNDNPRIYFIHDSLMELKEQLQKIGSDLLIVYGTPLNEILKLINQLKIQNIYCNEDYEPLALKRDQKIKEQLLSYNIGFHLYKDQVIFAKKEILNQQNRPYTVYTPYKNAWLVQCYNNLNCLTEYPIIWNNFFKCQPQNTFFNPLQTRFKTRLELKAGNQNANRRLNLFLSRIGTYNQERNFPAIQATSHLGTDLRFGTISIRHLLRSTFNTHGEGARAWINELIWREFFSQILFNFPHVADQPFRREYINLKYQNNPQWFDSWCTGNTGYPIVDAGMRELNQTGFMHNRVRMICASFLCKDLLIDWRWGEQYFARKLLDYDLASNNGNWQWCASTGCDAQPYFRIFNPILQSQKFDPAGDYIRKYIPELAHLDSKQIHFPQPENNNLFANDNYLLPIVNHHEQIKLAKAMYSNIHAKLINKKEIS